MSPDRRRLTLNAPPVVEALEWMTRIYDSLGGAEAVYAFQSSAQVGQLDPFLLGKVALKIDGYWTFTEGLAQFGANLNYGVAVPPLPAAKQGQTPASWVSGWCFAIPATARHKEGGWELLKFMSSQRATQILGKPIVCGSAPRGWSLFRRRMPTAKSTNGFTILISPVTRPFRTKNAKELSC
jgi:multiple sugar transport system permease protein